MLKGQLLKTSGLQFDKWLFGPEKFSGLSKPDPRSFHIVERRRTGCEMYKNEKRTCKTCKTTDVKYVTLSDVHVTDILY